MTKTKKLVSLLLILCMLLSVVPMMTFTASAEEKAVHICYIDADSNGTFNGNDVKYVSITAALAVAKPDTETADKPTVIRMIGDSDENITIASERFITLDLNGYVLKGDGTTSVIENNGTLTVSDSNGTAVHNFKVGSNGLWTLTDESATVNFEDLTARPDTDTVVAVKGGAITGGIGKKIDIFCYGAGIYTGKNTKLNICGGNIVGNSTNYHGGGVYGDEGSVINVSRGNVIGNYASYIGGGICFANEVTVGSGSVNFNTSDGAGGIGGITDSTTTVTVTGGEISYNKCTSESITAGGIVCTNLIMSNGKINYNEAEYTGGVKTSNSFTMTGGSIAGNKGNDYGGVVTSNSFTMTGGSISGNKGAVVGGVYTFMTGIYLGGDAEITDNTDLTGNVKSNLEKFTVYETYISAITLGTSTDGKDGNGVLKPSDKMNIGITLWDTDEYATTGGLVSTYGQFTTNGTKTDEAYFFSDNTAYADKYNDGGYLELVTGYTVTCANSDNGAISVVNQKSAYDGETVIVTATPDDGYAVDTISVYKTGDTATTVTVTDGTFKMPVYAVTVSATFKTVADPVCYIDADSNGTFNGNDVKYATITAALAAAKPDTETADKPTVIRMIGDSNENITIASERFITLDLNGFVLKGDDTTSVIENNGTLTVTDSNGTAVHNFKVGSNGLWTLTDESATVNFEDLTARPDTDTVVAVKGGVITGGIGKTIGTHCCGAGIYTGENTNLNICGGNIAGNSTSYRGGGVYGDKGSVINVSGGNVIGNYATSIGGGICFANEVTVSSGSVNFNTGGGAGGIGCVGTTTVIVTGGEISYNKCTSSANTGGGIGCTNLIMSNGKINYNEAGFAGGVYCTGTANISGGEISYNKAKSTGGVYCSIANISGGEISYNTGTEYCGGVALSYSSNSFTMTGGSITGNKGAVVGGVYTFVTGIYLGGDAEITDNTDLTGNVKSNLVKFTVYDSAIYPITLGTSTDGKDGNGVLKPADGMNIGITLGDTDEYLNNEGSLVSTYGQFTTNGSTDDLKYFSSDNASYTVKYNNNGYLELVTLDNIPAAVSSATYSASLTLKDNIDVNFKMKEINNADKDLLEIRINGETQTFDFADGVASGISVAVAPENMSDKIHFVIVYDDIQVKNFYYSVADYCNAVFNAEGYGKDSPLGQLCEAVLNYGKYAEDNKNKNTASTLNEGHEVTLTAPEKSNKAVTTSTDVTAAGASLTLGSTISMNFYVKVKDSGIDLTETDENGQYKNFQILNNKATKEKVVTNLTVTPLTDNADGYNYKITISNIYAEQMSREYTLTLNGDNTFKVTYGVYDYCKEAQDMTGDEFTDTFKTLCKAIYNYGVKANAIAG